MNAHQKGALLLEIRDFFRYFAFFIKNAVDYQDPIKMIFDYCNCIIIHKFMAYWER